MLQQNFIVLLNQNNIGVMVGDTQPHRVFACVNIQIDVKHQRGIRRLNFHIRRFHVCLDGGVLFLRDNADDLQLLVGITGDDTRTDCGCHAVQSACVGDDDTFDILNDIAADEQPDLLRHSAQHLRSLGGGIGQRNGFGAAHGRAQLFTQDVQILLVQMVAFFHGDPSFFDTLPYNITNAGRKINDREGKHVF